MTMKPTIQELDAAIESCEESLSTYIEQVEINNGKDKIYWLENLEKEQTKLKALKFARAMMEPSDEVINAVLREKEWAVDLQAMIKAATEQAWEEVAVPKEVEGE